MGTVGSGKSTQIKLFASELKKRGLRVKITFLKTGHLLAYILEIVLARMLIGKRNDVYPIRALIDEKANLFKKIFKFWLILDVISICVKFLICIYIPINIGYTVLVEEYILATIADYAFLSSILDLPFKNTTFTLNFLLRLAYFRGISKIIFLDANNEILNSRWSIRDSPPERSDYISMQRTFLLSFSKRFSNHKLLYIDTSKLTSKETHELITEYLIVH